MPHTGTVSENMKMSDVAAGSKTCIIVFVRAPEPGKVKTRLARKLDPGVVLGLYRCFVADILSSAKSCQIPVHIFYYPPTALPEMVSWLGSDWAFTPQSGGTIGDKMAEAFSRMFARGYDRAILIGSDFPDLPPAILLEAESELANHKAVIGPARDGGYYLIGFQRNAYSKTYFENLPWSTDTVFKETLRRFSNNAIQPHCLPAWHDIDTCEDLAHFIKHIEGKAEIAGETIRYLREQGLL